MNPNDLSLGFAYGAAAGILISTLTKMTFMTFPLLVVGGVLGAAFMGGLIDIDMLTDVVGF